MEGERDYSKITGSTGPCVWVFLGSEGYFVCLPSTIAPHLLLSYFLCIISYPALHLYLYSFLLWLTEGGKILKNAQAFFALIYLANQFFVMKIYKSAGVSISRYKLPF